MKLGETINCPDCGKRTRWSKPGRQHRFCPSCANIFNPNNYTGIKGRELLCDELKQAKFDLSFAEYDVKRYKALVALKQKLIAELIGKEQTI